MKGMAIMEMSDIYINDQLNKAQKLLWGGSETENIEAHNIIAKLIEDRLGEDWSSAGLKNVLRLQLNIAWKLLTKLAIVDIINIEN